MASVNAVQSSTNLFCRLTWQATIPLEIRLADGEPGAGSGLDTYYMTAPRYSYLPLLLSEIRENLVDLVLDDQQLAETNETEWWFEEEPDPAASGGLASQGPCKWHWPLDLIELHSMISRPSTSTSPSTKPLRLVLHLSAPPQDKLMLPNSVEACKTQFVNQLKEADFIRWGNVRKVTGLRRQDLEAGWDGMVQDDYDLHSRMSSRLFPLPIPIAALPSQSSALPSRPASTDPGGSASASKFESSYTARAIPLKIYLPDNAPVVQEVVPPLGADGQWALYVQLGTHPLTPSRQTHDPIDPPTPAPSSPVSVSLAVAVPPGIPHRPGGGSPARSRIGVVGYQLVGE
ncbi:autophagy-related protein 5, partial [Tremellales sp. Uapishka_1]